MSEQIILNLKEDVMGSFTLDLEPKQTHQGIRRRDTQNYPVLRPRLACKVNIYRDKIILSQDGREFDFSINGQSEEALQKLFLMMDGTRSLSDLQQMFSPGNPELIDTIVRHLDKQGVLDDNVQLRVHSGIDTLLELEALTRELLAKGVEENSFWQLIKSPAPELPINVFYGFALEHYHLLSRKCTFQSPVLGFPSSAKVRQLISELYCQESGQDELIMEALQVIGISDEDLTDTMPLPETMALSNGLAFWAHFEPLFFLSTLGAIAGNTFENFELYLLACERLELDSGFIVPLRQLVNSKLNQEPENLTRRLFQEIPHIDRETRQRFRGQTYLFLEMYNNFYTAIGRYYSSAPLLLRRVSAI